MQDSTSDEPDGDDEFANQLARRYENLLELGSAAAEMENSNDASSSRLNSAAKVLEWLEEWKSEIAMPPGGAEAATSNPVWLPNLEQLGRFRILDTVGRGGYGIVVRAEDPELERIVAIKIPRLDAALSAESRARFVREAKVAARLNHPGIVAVHETGSQQGIHYIVSEFIEGENLAMLVARGQRLSAADAATLVAKLADAVQHAHEAGVLHRDLKPSNVLLEGDHFDSPKITDFGLATLGNENDVTQTGSVLGTPAFMSPEQALGKRDLIGPATDVYGLGAILFQVLTGAPPYSGETIVETIRQIVDDPPPMPRRLMASCPRDLEAICLKCLAKDPRRRYESANDLATDLRRFLAGDTVIARTPSRIFRAWRFCRNHPVGSLSLLMLVALAIAGPIVTANQMRLSRRAIESEKRLQRSRYVSDMNLAIGDWQTANIRRCGELLERYLPENNTTDLREFEWYYLWNQWLSGERTPVEFHHENLESIALSPDELVLAAGRYEGIVVLHDRTSGKTIREWRAHGARIIELDFSADGSMLATASYDGLRIWDVDTGELLAEYDGEWSADFADRANVLAFRDDRSVKVVRFESKISSASEIVEIEMADENGVFTVSLSADGKTAASAGFSGGLVLWDTETGTRKQEWRDHDSRVWVIDFSLDGNRLAGGDVTGGICLYDLSDSQLTAKFDGHTTTVISLAFDELGSQLVSGSTDNTVKQWSVPDGSLIRNLRGHVAEVKGVTFANQGAEILSASMDGNVKRWTLDSISTGDVLTHPSGVNAVTFAPDGETLATTCEDGKLRIWNAADGTPLKTIDAHDGPAWDCQFVRAGHDVRVVTTGGDSHARLWDLDTGQVVCETTCRPQATDPPLIAVHPDGDRVAFQHTSKSVAIWNVQTDSVEQTLVCNQVGGVAFSMDGKLIAAASGGTVMVWNVLSGDLVRRLVGDSRSVQQIAFSPDGKRLAAACYDQTIKRWEVSEILDAPASAVLQPNVLIGQAAYVIAIAYSPDGRTLVSGGDDRVVRLWDPGTRDQRCVFPGHRGGIQSFAFSPSGQTLASASMDFDVRIWRATR